LLAVYTASNRQALQILIEAVASRHPVVLLGGSPGESGRDAKVVDHPGVIRLHADRDPATALGVQSGVIAGASAFVGTYGGLSQVATAHGVFNVAIYSEGKQLRSTDTATTERMGRLTGGTFNLTHVGALDLLETIFAPAPTGADPLDRVRASSA